MASEFDIALRNAAATVSRYIQDAATMQVETRFVDTSRPYNHPPGRRQRDRSAHARRRGRGPGGRPEPL